MSDITVTKTRLLEGVWEGAIYREALDKGDPKVEVTWLQKKLEGVTVLPLKDGSGWSLRIEVPAYAIADGVQTFLINDAESQEMIGEFTIIAGEELSYDIRTEISLLREELDLLKRAFRRHCLETM